MPGLEPGRPAGDALLQPVPAPAPVETSNLSSAELELHPILQQWEYNANGSLSGRVYGKRSFKEGDNMNTSVVPPEQRFPCYVVTGSGSIYRLGEPKTPGPAFEPKKSRRLVREPSADVVSAAVLPAQSDAVRPSRDRSAGAATSTRQQQQQLSNGGESKEQSTSGLSTSLAKAPHPISAITSTSLPEIDLKKARHPNQYTKVAVQSPSRSPKTARSPVQRATASVEEAKKLDRPKHANQYTYRQPQLPQQLPQPERPKATQQHAKHPNQHTYRRPNQHTKHPNQYTPKQQGERPKQPNQYTHKQQKPAKHPNQYTYRERKVPAREKPSSAHEKLTCGSRTGGFLSVSRHGDQWAALYKSNGHEQHLGLYATVQAAAEATVHLLKPNLAASDLQLQSTEVDSQGKRPCPPEPCGSPASKIAKASSRLPCSPAASSVRIRVNVDGIDPLSRSRGEGSPLCNSAAQDDRATAELQAPPILSSKNQSGFQGVNKSSRSGCWEAVIQDRGKRRFLGCFQSAEEAAQAYAREHARHSGAGPSNEASAAKEQHIKHEGHSVSPGCTTDNTSPQVSGMDCGMDQARAAHGLAGADDRGSLQSRAWPARSVDESEHDCSLWVQCDSCTKWRRLSAASLCASSHPSNRWFCALNTDEQRQTCDAPQEESEGALGGQREESPLDPGRQKGGRELRPLRPPKPQEEVPRDILRARLPGSTVRRRDRDVEARPARHRVQPHSRQQQGQQQYLSHPYLGRATTRIAVFEEGVWRFQPAVGEQYQIEPEAHPSCPTAEQCRKRQDLCIWTPDKAALEGINVQEYLIAVAKLYAVAQQPHAFSAELALQLLLSHDFDVLAAAHSMAAAIGADKHLTPDAPISATMSLVRGRSSGVRVSLNLALRHLAASVGDGQPQYFVRSTRSRTVTLDAMSTPCVWLAEEEQAFTDGMRRDSKHLRTIQKSMLPQKTIAQVVEFYYSARGQRIKAAVLAERRAAEKPTATSSVSAGAGTSYNATASSVVDEAALKRRRRPAHSSFQRSSGTKLSSKRPRPHGDISAEAMSKATRYGPRVFVHLSQQGESPGVRVRLCVRSVDQRCWGDSGARKQPAVVPSLQRGAPRGSRSSKLSTENRHMVAAKVRAAGSGRVGLTLNIFQPRGPQPLAVQRPKRVRVENPRHREAMRDAGAGSDDDDDDDADDGSEMVCTWIQCDRCSKWRIVPECSVGKEGEPWYCEMNMDWRHNRCSVPQQPDDAVADFPDLAPKRRRVSSAAGSRGRLTNGASSAAVRVRATSSSSGGKRKLSVEQEDGSSAASSRRRIAAGRRAPLEAAPVSAPLLARVVVPAAAARTSSAPLLVSSAPLLVSSAQLPTAARALPIVMPHTAWYGAPLPESFDQQLALSQATILPVVLPNS